jgi:hypothetical protein
MWRQKMNETKEQLRLQILDAARRFNVKESKGFLVASKSVQGWSVVGYDDSKIASESAYNLAVLSARGKGAIESGYADVFVLDKDTGELCRLQIL